MQPQPNRRRLSPTAIVIVPLAVALVMTLFAWPSARLEPRDLPVGVAGPARAVAPVEQRLAAADGSFDVHRYADEASARQAIEDRDVYGAVVITRDGAKALTASAASRTVAQMLTRAANDPHRPAPGATAPVQDVVPDEQASSALPSTVLPLVIAGSIAGVLTLLLAGGFVSRVALLVSGSLLGGLAANVVLQSWLGVVDGDWLANAGGLGLTILATGAVVAGLQALIGQKGAVVAGVTMTLIGNPFSGASSAPELMPQPVGAIGQLMPPGAGSELLRSTGFFDGAAAGGHVAVLCAWTLAGLGILLVAGLRGRRPVAAPVPQPA
jgi:ABC-2 family transporter protein